MYYAYPGADDIDYPEIYAGLGWNWLSGKVWYSNDFGNSGESAFYYEANAEYELPANFGLNAHIGYSDGDAIDLFYEDSYMDWSVGVTYDWSNFTFGLKYADGSDLSIAGRHAGRREQQRRRGDLLDLDCVPVVAGVSPRASPDAPDAKWPGLRKEAGPFCLRGYGSGDRGWSEAVATSLAAPPANPHPVTP